MVPPRSRLVATIACIGLPALLAGCAGMLLNKREPLDVQVARTPAQVARGSYLVNHVTVCFDCHTPETAPSSHVADMSRRGQGGMVWDKKHGLPGEIYAPNITPDDQTGLGKWSDGEILRALREGVSKDGHALFPLMPYMNYRQLSDDDAQAIVAYLRSLAPAANVVPRSKLDFPLNIIVNTIPKPLDGPVGAPPAEKLAYGEHLFKMASCNDCHTPIDDKGKPLPGLYAAGGMAFHVGEGHWPAPNITQDKETGIGSWTDAQIEVAITQGVRPDGKGVRPPMPWQGYAGLTKQDRAALVAYMRSIPAVKHDVGKRW